MTLNIASAQTRTMPTDRPFRPGNEALLADQPIAFFRSHIWPGDLILNEQDWANTREADDAPVISGFHTPVERDVMRILLRGGCLIIYTFARSIEGTRLPAAVRAAQKQDHALYPAAARQTTARTATVLIAHASIGGKTERLAAEAVAMGLLVFTLPSPSNASLIGIGAEVI